MQNCWLQSPVEAPKLNGWGTPEMDPQTIPPIDLSLFPGSFTYLGASRGLQSQKFWMYIDINEAYSGPYFDLSWPPNAENQ